MDNSKKPFQTSCPEEHYTETELRKLRERIGSTSYAEQNMSIALTEIDRLCQALDLSSDIRSDTQSIYKNIIESDIINNNSIAMIISGIIYFSCLKKEVPRGIKHVATASVVQNGRPKDDSWGTSTYGNKRTKIGRAFREIANELGEIYTPIDPREFITWYCSLLGLDQEIQQKAIEILDKTEEDRQAGGKPSVVAAGAVYFAATLFDEIDLSQEEVSSVSVTNVRTVRKHYRDLMEFFSEREDSYDISAQPYVGDAHWLKPNDKEKLVEIGEGEWTSKKRRTFHKHELHNFFEYELISLQEGEPKLTCLGEKYIAGQLDPSSLKRTKIWPPYQDFITWMLRKEPISSVEIQMTYHSRIRHPSILKKEGYLEGSSSYYRVSKEAREILHRNSQIE